MPWYYVEWTTHDGRRCSLTVLDEPDARFLFDALTDHAKKNDLPAPTLFKDTREKIA